MSGRQPRGTRGLAPRATELAATVSQRELMRLLGMPRGRGLEGELRERVDHARAWYAAHGRPFAASRRVSVQDVSATLVRLADGSELRSSALAEGLRATQGLAVVVLAVSAGREVAAEARRLWKTDRPDAAFVLDRFAAAVTEALVLWSSGALCRAASGSGETLLPPLAPGCGDFDIGDQQQLMRLLGGAAVAPDSPQASGDAGGKEAPPGETRLRLGPVELLPTGALDPPHSLLAALGMTRQPLAAVTPQDLCRSCALEPCGFRRVPFARPAVGTEGSARADRNRQAGLR